MLKEPAGHSIEILPQADRRYLEQQYCENVREIYQTIHTSSLEKFTYPWIEALSDQLNTIIHALQWLPEAAFRELIEVIQGLREARNELRLACFLFDVEEINPVHRLLMRNRAIWRGEELLHRMLHVWPARAH